MAHAGSSACRQTENFIQAEAEAKKNLIDLELNRVACKDGRELNFVISKDVWMLSMLESSQNMQNSFRNCLTCSIHRDTQLQGLKEDVNLWKRVQFWVSDLLEFQSAEERLNLPTAADGVCPFMSPCHFTSEEAKILGGLLMPNTKDLYTTMTILLKEKASSGVVAICASHYIAPVLAAAFMIKKNIQKQDAFKNDKKAWIKKQNKVMKKK